jgi:hypothetical protein
VAASTYSTNPWVGSSSLKKIKVLKKLDESYLLLRVYWALTVVPWTRAATPIARAKIRILSVVFWMMSNEKMR